MIHNSGINDFGRDLPNHNPDFIEAPVIPDVPMSLEHTPDGRETVVIGDVEGSKDYNHMQGDNSYGFKGTCGLVSCEDVLRQFGVDVTEDVVVDYAARNGLCHLGTDGAHSGGTTVADQAQILNDMGVPAHYEIGSSMEELAGHIEGGQEVIAEVNAGVLWNDVNSYENGISNHAIVITGVARDPLTGELEGFYINDSGRGFTEDSGRFVDVRTMGQAWQLAGGNMVVTDIVKETL